jgi:perosamine synthetase
MNPELTGTQNGFWMPTLVFSQDAGITREILQAAFASENIDARVFFWPLSSLPPFEPVLKNRVSYDIPVRAINLPSYHDLSESDLRRVVNVIRALPVSASSNQ